MDVRGYTPSDTNGRDQVDLPASVFFTTFLHGILAPHIGEELVVTIENQRGEYTDERPGETPTAL